jgi:hypothetical protein
MPGTLPRRNFPPSRRLCFKKVRPLTIICDKEKRRMRLFKCQHCGQILYFENQTCIVCSRRLGFIPEISVLSALEPQDNAQNHAWRALAVPGKIYRFCANADFQACNWLIECNAAERYCTACSHNRTVPDLGNFGNLEAWRKIEAAKHRLFYGLLKLRLPLGHSDAGTDRRLSFDFLASMSNPAGKIMTGHDNGLITLAVEEADDVERERRRTAMHEPYRTLLGHFRHEVGHYYWDQLVLDGGKIDFFRKSFGDERVDYSAALQIYYAQGAPPDWPERFISAYASSHPWEDFAETWAHYLHIVDALEMAAAFNINIHPKIAQTQVYDAVADFDPYRTRDFDQMIETWIPLSNALNCLNRTMGLADLYPFVLAPLVIAKLRAIHNLIQATDTPDQEQRVSDQPS